MNQKLNEKQKSNSQQATQEVAEWKRRVEVSDQRLKRTATELEEYHRSSRHALEQSRKYASIDLMRDLLPIADNLERAILTGRHSGDIDAMIDSVELIRNQFYDVLKEYGLNEIKSMWQKFDPNVHTAINENDHDEHPGGSVIEVLESGYRLHDRVVRLAKVVVSRDQGQQASNEPRSEESKVMGYVII